MPRNPKCRRICMEPACREFFAEGSQRRIPISMEEVESLRLCDMEGFSQDEAAAQMNVSRVRSSVSSTLPGRKPPLPWCAAMDSPSAADIMKSLPGNAAGNAAIPVGDIK